MARIEQSTDPLSFAIKSAKSNTNSNGSHYVDIALDEMKSGSKFIKVKSKSWRKPRMIELSQDHLTLQVTRQSCGPRKSKYVDIKKIREIRVGYQSPIWEQLGRTAPNQDRCFSLVLEHQTDPLNLVAANQKSASNWLRGLRHLSSNIENLDVKGKHLVWVWEHFKKADKDSNGLLTFKEVRKLLSRLNFEASPNYVESALKEFDSSGDQCLSFEEFTEFFKKITWRPEIERLYKTYCDADLKLQPNEICRFFRIEQANNAVTIDMAKEMIEKFEPDEECRRANEMTAYGFTYMLMSPIGDIFNLEHRKVTMDMTQPLSHYFIASSHNTYLTDDQLFGKSSVESYIRAFEAGCRCVELDCWDGDDGEPIIYHGHTLTSKIKFHEVIEIVRDYAFKVSEYPVILSIENHCSVSQQSKMAKILKDLLGSMLLMKTVDSEDKKLPSPEALKGKILVKGKRLPVESSSDGEVSNEDEAADIEQEGGKKEKSQKHIKLARDLSDVVVYAISRHFKTFDDARQRSDHRFISSLNEDKALSLARKDPSGFVKHNSWQLTRIYPKGSRTNSSNYSPLQMWNSGCQIVALNYQTKDMETHLNESRFRSNGGCGFVLKPRCLLGDSDFNSYKIDKHSSHTDPVEMEIRIITAQQLPKPPKNEKDVIDPYVVVTILGCDCDNFKQQTSAIENNGFNPAWLDENPMNFKILIPSLAFVQFKVMDKDSHGNDDLVGVYMLALDDIATGYRHIHLLTEGRQELTPATLFVHISINRSLSKL